jgi:hypothetical protein
MIVPNVRPILSAIYSSHLTDRIGNAQDVRGLTKSFQILSPGQVLSVNSRGKREARVLGSL